VARLNGITTVLSIPGGGSVRGTSALMHLDGWTQEDITLRAPAALHVQWPEHDPDSGVLRDAHVTRSR
jgi:hypothetical protein